MPRYEIVAHVTCDLTGETPEDAAAQFQRQVLAQAGIADEVLQLAVWRQEPAAGASPLPATLRRQLIAFFAALERSAEEAETAFRERVEAILAVPGPVLERATHPRDSGARAGATPPAPKPPGMSDERRARSGS